MALQSQSEAKTNLLQYCATRDIRVIQLTIMAGLLFSGVILRDFSLKFEQILAVFAAGLFTQFIFLKRLHLEQKGYLSALISCFGISILLRSSELWPFPLVACIAISSKFLIRPNGSHLLNPANFGIIFALTFIPQTWVTSGQWGSDLSTALWLIVLGAFIADNARSLQLAYWFLGAYALLILIIRHLWMGYPSAVFLHQFQNGALLLFAFFMITDPMTSPKHNTARRLHAILVAILAYLWQYFWYMNQGVIWALFFANLLVPFWNRLFPACSPQWRKIKGKPL